MRSRLGIAAGEPKNAELAPRVKSFSRKRVDFDARVKQRLAHVLPILKLPREPETRSSIETAGGVDPHAVAVANGNIMAHKSVVEGEIFEITTRGQTVCDAMSGGSYREAALKCRWCLGQGSCGC